jgi:thioesterase domain-containing protein
LSVGAGVNLEVSADILKPLNEEERLDYLTEKLKTSGVMPATVQSTQIRNLLKVFKANDEAGDRYKPKGDVGLPHIALFQASEVHAEDIGLQVGGQENCAWGWNQYALTDVQTYTIPGDHITMLADPHVQLLAEQLKICINKTELLTEEK